MLVDYHRVFIATAISVIGLVLLGVAFIGLRKSYPIYRFSIVLVGLFANYIDWYFSPIFASSASHLDRIVKYTKSKTPESDETLESVKIHKVGSKAGIFPMQLENGKFPVTHS